MRERQRNKERENVSNNREKRDYEEGLLGKKKRDRR